MNIHRALPIMAAFSLFGIQAAAAQELAFYQKASEAPVPVAGNVAMRITIGTDGEVSNARIVRSSGSDKIDTQAVSWMQSQFLRPVTLNGDAIEFSVVKEISFTKSAALHAGLR